MKLHPFWEVAKKAHELMLQGATVYEQFNCAACGIKQTIETPNVWYKTGRCEECGHITNIEKDGCNMMVHLRVK
jgi:hypothetical protein